MSRTPDYRGTAEVFWSGGSQAVRLPAECRFEASEVEIVKVGSEVTLRPRGKDWRAWFDSAPAAQVPPRDQPGIEERDPIR